ncbi:hypothetical protein [Frankia sp. AgB32]|uniref:hypothetical protein n=1 Tax=Frankia sp. AgB32 TaxID=631119 RepID=UPI00200E9A78|nr:hypothetical protein [Frankia sp. AgB32]MCK9896910.1 hypothetical protein [Frankia sp. AgB32]
MPKHANWDLAPITRARQALLPTNVVRTGPMKNWGTGATHHKISKDTLDLLGRALTSAMNPGGTKEDRRKIDPNTVGAAKQFWEAVQNCTTRELLSLTPDVTKILWNLPVNLEIGPAEILENPGASFDPNSEPSPEGDGRRILSAESAILKKMEDLFLPKLAGARPTGLSAQDWKTLRDHLIKAQAVYKADLQARGRDGILAPPRVEQWIEGTKTITPQEGPRVVVPAFQRKRLRYFPGQERARAWYVNRPTPIPDPANEFGALGARLPIRERYDLTDREGRKHIVQVTMDSAALRHTCQRHCYTYFTWADADIKLVNNFWPQGRASTVDQYLTIISAALPDIAQAGLDHILAEFDEREQKLGRSITVVNVPHGADVLFFIADFTRDADLADADDSDEGAPDGDGSNSEPAGDDPIVWALNLATVAPDGPSAESFPTQELKAAKAG